MTRPLLFAFVLALVLGCTKRPQKEPPSNGSRETTLKDALALQLVPAIDGGAYAMDMSEGVIWYVREDRAVRVRGLEGSMISSVTPAVEGGLYLDVFDEERKGLWYLKGTTIRKVEESPPAPVATLPSDRVPSQWLWVLAQWERLQSREHQDTEAD